MFTTDLAVLYLPTWLPQFFNPMDAEVSFVEELRIPTLVTTRNLLMQESVGDGKEDGVSEGIRSFFHSGKHPRRSVLFIYEVVLLLLDCPFRRYSHALRASALVCVSSHPRHQMSLWLLQTSRMYMLHGGEHTLPS